MLFVLILILALLGLVVFAVVVANRVNHGEARFDSGTGKLMKDERQQPNGPAVPAQRIGTNRSNERKTDNE